MVLNEICHAYFISKIGWVAGKSIYAGTIDTSGGTADLKDLNEMGWASVQK